MNDFTWDQRLINYLTFLISSNTKQLHMAKTSFNKIAINNVKRYAPTALISSDTHSLIQLYPNIVAIMFVPIVFINVMCSVRFCLIINIQCMLIFYIVKYFDCFVFSAFFPDGCFEEICKKYKENHPYRRFRFCSFLSRFRLWMYNITHKKFYFR